jgi:hypothetical protein
MIPKATHGCSDSMRASAGGERLAAGGVDVAERRGELVGRARARVTRRQQVELPLHADEEPLGDRATRAPGVMNPTMTPAMVGCTPAA